MFTLQISIMLLLVIIALVLLAKAIFAHGRISSSQKPTEQDIQALIDEANKMCQITEQMMEGVRKMGGFHIVKVASISDSSKAAVIEILMQASKSPYCDDLYEMPEPNTIVFWGEEGKLEAQKLIKELEKLDCEGELLRLN